MPATPAFTPSDLVARFESAARAAKFRVERFGSVAGLPLLALTKRAPGPRPRLYFSAGIHGDEPAGPLALLDLLEAGAFDSRAHWLLCPLLNPTGFLRGTRENADGVDLNRDYKHLVSSEIRAHVRWLQRQPNFDFTICLHEDWESQGFYLYELNPTDRPSLVDEMLSAVEQCCPIETAAVIDGRESVARGLIRPIADPLQREQWPEAIYLVAHHTRLTYTLESPSALDLPTRTRALRAAVEASLPD